MPADLRPNAYARARAARGFIPHDLTVTNPTACGIEYPPELGELLARGGASPYRPDAKGLRSAREAVAAEYALGGRAIDPDRIVLTASSSEAYGFLFKLLCNPGEGVLVPAPSYPLFDHLATLEGVRAVPYVLDPEHTWQPQTPAAIDARGARAAIVVHPNNPTGSWVARDGAEALAGCTGNGLLPLIADEVFLDYFWDGAAPESYVSRTRGLTFTLGGLSKSCGLPHFKLSWIVVGGPDDESCAAIEALEFVGDNYLSVATPIQEALGDILRAARPVRESIRARCRRNLEAVRAALVARPDLELLAPSGGWSAVLRFPRVVGEEALAIELLERHGIAVHPGYFFDFAGEGYLVVSLLTPPASFDAGIETIKETIAARV